MLTYIDVNVFFNMLWMLTNSDNVNRVFLNLSLFIKINIAFSHFKNVI